MTAGAARILLLYPITVNNCILYTAQYRTKENCDRGGSEVNIYSGRGVERLVPLGRYL